MYLQISSALYFLLIEENISQNRNNPFYFTIVSVRMVTYYNKFLEAYYV